MILSYTFISLKFKGEEKKDSYKKTGSFSKIPKKP